MALKFRLTLPSNPGMKRLHGAIFRANKFVEALVSLVVVDAAISHDAQCIGTHVYTLEEEMKFLVAIMAVAGLAFVGCGSSGGGQSEACASMVACNEAAAEAGAVGYTAGTYDGTYDADGTCWSTTTEAADACTAACESAIDGFTTFVDSNGNTIETPEECEFE